MAADFSAIEKGIEKKKESHAEAEKVKPNEKQPPCFTETGRGRRKSDRLTPRGCTAVKNKDPETHEKLSRSRKRISDSSCSSNVGVIFENVEQVKQNTPKRRSGSSNSTGFSTKLNSNEGISPFRIGVGKRGVSKRGAKKNIDDADGNSDRPKQKEDRKVQSSVSNCETHVKDFSKQGKMHTPSPASKRHIAEKRIAMEKRNSPMLEKRNSKGESPLQVAAVKVISLIFS